MSAFFLRFKLSVASPKTYKIRELGDQLSSEEHVFGLAVEVAKRQEGEFSVNFESVFGLGTRV